MNLTSKLSHVLAGCVASLIWLSAPMTLSAAAQDAKVAADGDAGAPTAEECQDSAWLQMDGRGVSFSELDAPSAISICLAALEDSPDDHEILAYLARAYAKAELWPQMNEAADASSASNHPAGLWYKGVIHDIGFGVETDFVEAIYWYRQAAELGYAPAQHNLGAKYDNGEGVARDDAEAARWFRQAAERGYASAQHRLGEMYENGEGVQNDNAEAMRWYRQAAEQGFANSQFKLGESYMNGFVVNQDIDKAAHWFSRAVQQGHAAARTTVAVTSLEEFKKSGDPDYLVEALRWFRLVAEQDDATGETYSFVAEQLAIYGDLDKALRVSRLAAQQEGATADIHSLLAEQQAIFDATGAKDAEVMARRKAFDAYGTRLGERHPATLQSAADLATILYRTGEAEEALGLAEMVAALARETRETVTEYSALITIKNIAGAQEDESRAALALQRMNQILPQSVPNELREHTKTELSRLGKVVDEIAKAQEEWHQSRDLASAARALSLYQQVLAIEQQTYGPRHVTTAGTHQSLGSWHTSLGDLPAALTEYETALDIIETQLGAEHSDTSDAMEQVAKTLVSMERYAEAESYLRTALQAREKESGPDDLETLKTLSVLSEVLGLQGEYREAERLARRAYETYVRVLGPSNSRTVDTARRLASVLRHLGQDEKAEAVRLESFDAFRQTPGPANERTITSMRLYAFKLMADGRSSAAEAILRQALRIAESTYGPDSEQAVTTLGDLASTLDFAGRWAEAETLNRRVLASLEANKGPEHPDTLLAISSLAGTLLGLGKIEEAETYLRRELEGNKRVHGPDHLETLTSLANIGVVLSRRNKHDEAERIFRKVFQARSKLHLSGRVDDMDLWESMTNLSGGLFRLERFEEAERLARQVVDAAELAGLQNSYNLVRLARILSALERPREALSYARRAVRNLESRHASRSKVLADAEATRKGHDISAVYARSLLVRAAWAVSRAGSGAAPEEHPDALRAEAFVAAQESGVGGAAEALIRAAARRAASDAGLAAVVRDWEQALDERRRLDEQFAPSFTVGTGADDLAQVETRTTLSKRRETVSARIASAGARLLDELPRFFDLVSPAAVSVSDLQGTDGVPLLAESEALILLSPPEDEFPGLVWAVTREHVAWAEIPLDETELSDKIAHLHALLDGGSGTRGALPSDAASDVQGYDRELARQLHHALFGAPEIRAVIAGKPDWVLVPQGALLSLPFAALVTAPPEGEDTDPKALRRTAWLGLERALAVLPSVATMHSLRRLAKERQVGAGVPFFGIGDPAFEGAPAEENDAALVLADASSFFRDATGETDSVRALPRLPGTRAEVEAMAAAFGAGPQNVLLGREANETRLAEAGEQGELGRARVVLMATHGLMAGSFDGLAEPALALTPPEGGPRLIDPAPAPEGSLLASLDPVELSVAAAAQQGARIDDGLLTASEAAQLDLDADWVILSACDTAAGASPDAQGLTGLARAFFYAGARALLVSHWKVRDDVAARLTTDAVRRSQAGSSPSRTRAFQAAMRAILEDRSQDNSGRALSHPAAWAPFQIIGVE